MPKCNFNKVAKQGIGVLLEVCCIFSEHLFLTKNSSGWLLLILTDSPRI